ncbi:MAG: L-lactate permease [Proteobacteria bacterium]|jgi:L-lactate transport|nr:L-lactate permease [Pseudomonadota bacterium]MBK9253040.1 L-lactate permease [Pseudomonadota bacterium]MCC6632966.1 L-lactate permease [Gammaproteobacteria bacterium]
MWQQNYLPVADNLGLSALLAALPIFMLLLLIGVLRKPAWVAALAGLATAALVALFVYGMPIGLVASSASMGASFGLFPIGWIVFWAVVLYRITADTGNFEIIKDSIGGLTADRRLQALLIAFALGAFIEGAAGFGTPVAVAAAMLTGLGFSPFYAAGICLLANTAPVAFGSIGVPVTTLASVTGLPELELSAWVGRICAPVSVFVPAYLVLVMGGWKGLKGVLPAAIVAGVSFASMQLFVSNKIGPQLVDIMAALTAIIAMVVLLKVWHPKDKFVLAGEHEAVLHVQQHGFGRTVLGWSPYLYLVVLVLIWGSGVIKGPLNSVTMAIEWPGLHNLVMRGAPVVAEPTPYAAVFSLNWLAAGGTACAFATMLAAITFRMSFAQYFGVIGKVAKQLGFSLLTIATVLALSYLMNYSGATTTLGLAFAVTGALFPFFSAMLGWLAVFLTGSDTSANALFGNLQVVTANSLGLDPALMASANSSGGVMGKMISLQSLAVAVAATGMARSEEGRLFRFTFKHSVFLGSVLGVITMIYAYI